MTLCPVPWCLLPRDHAGECVSKSPDVPLPTREAIVDAFAALLERIERLESRRLKPDVERALIVQAVRETVAGLEGP